MCPASIYLSGPPCQYSPQEKQTLSHTQVASSNQLSTTQKGKYRTLLGQFLTKSKGERATWCRQHANKEG